MAKQLDEIYATYAPYSLSGGDEQKVCDGVTDAFVPRSEALLLSVFKGSVVPGKGRMLDFGCGNGAFLKSYGKLFTEWDLIGYDVSDLHKDEVESLSPKIRFSSGGIENIEGRFDFISLVHVLEHLGDPLGLLSALAEKMEPGGTLLVQCPDYSSNPFDLVIFDHVSHFARHSLTRLVQRAGFSDVRVVNNFLNKELTVVATGHGQRAKCGEFSGASLQTSGLGAMQLAKDSVEFLKELSRWSARVKTKHYGIFGTSIAGVWLHSELGGGTSYFVDEDPARIGNFLFGAPVVSPQQTPRDSVLLFPMKAEVAEFIVRRLGGVGGADLKVYRGVASSK